MPSVFGRRSSSAANTAAAAANAAAATGSFTPQPPPLPNAYSNQTTASMVRAQGDGGRYGKVAGNKQNDEDISYSTANWSKSGREEASLRSVSGPTAVFEEQGSRSLHAPSQSRLFSSSSASTTHKGSSRSAIPYDSSTDSSMAKDLSNSTQNSPSTTSTGTFPIAGIQSTLPTSTQSMHDQRSIQSSVPSLSTAESILRETLARRSRCLAYVRRCLSAAGHPAQHPTPQHYPSNAQSWLDTVRITRRSLEAYYNSDAMRKRATRYYVAGCSLAPAMDLQGCDEFARAVLNVLSESESFGDGNEKDKAKMRNFFKSSIRGAGTSAGHAKRMAGLGELSNTHDGVSVGGTPMSMLTMSGVELIGTHVPYALDSLQTTITFLDLLQEVYCKLLVLSSAANSNTTVKDVDGLPTNSTPAAYEAYTSSLSVSTVEVIHKLDGKVKKMLIYIFKELDALARHLVKQELASVDPQMARDLASPSLVQGNGNSLASTETASEDVSSNTGSLRQQHALRNNPFTSSAPNLLIAVSSSTAQ